MTDANVATPSILIVEDDQTLRTTLAFNLQREGFGVVSAEDGEQALHALRTRAIDLVILDLMLPGMSGIELLRVIRSDGAGPAVIILSARGDEVDRVVGLEMGADDFVAKPYRLRELIARIRAVMRRSRSTAATSTSSVREIGDVRLDPDSHEVVVRGREVQLPLKEFKLLELLLENAGRVMSRSVIIDRVWGEDYLGDTKTLDVHIKRLRAKLEEDPRSPERILTVRGLGYKFQPPRA